MKQVADISAIAKASFMHDLQEMHLVSERIDWEVIAQSAHVIASAEQVICIGVGKSALMAKRCAATLTSIGKKSVFLHPTEALHGDIGILSPNDVVLVFSNSGNTEEIVSIMPYVKTHSKVIIGILGNRVSAISKFCEHIIDASIEKESCPLNTIPSSSLLITTAITNALIASVTVNLNVSTEIFATFHPAGQLGRNLLLTVDSAMISGKEALPFVQPGMNVRELIIIMSSKGLGCAIVSEDNNLILGFITDGDVRRCLQNNDDLSTVQAQHIMTQNPVTVHSTALLGEALSLMEDREHKIGVLPVSNDQGECIGIIRLHDIAGHIR